MNYIKLLLLLILSMETLPVWAQKKALIRSGFQAITGKPAVKTIAPPKGKTTAQLIAEAQAFINTHGRRPKAMIYANGQRLTLPQLTDEQRKEVQLGQAISNHFSRAAKRGIAVEFNPELSALQELVQAHPNIQASFLEGSTDPIEVLNRTKAFIQEHGVRPRATIYAANVHYKLADEMTPAEREEVCLGHSIQYILAQAAKQGTTQTPSIQELTQLWNNYSHIRQTAKPRDLLVQLQEYIRVHGRHPRSIITKHGQVVPTHELTPRQYEEASLARKISHILTQARQNPQLAQEPEIAQLASLWKRPAFPTPQEILLELQDWVAAHQGNRPRLNIYRNGIRVTVKNMTPQEYKEYQLGSRLQHLLDAGVSDPELRNKLWEIHELPTGSISGRNRK